MYIYFYLSRGRGKRVPREPRNERHLIYALSDVFIHAQPPLNCPSSSSFLWKRLSFAFKTPPFCSPSLSRAFEQVFDRTVNSLWNSCFLNLMEKRKRGRETVRERGRVVRANSQVLKTGGALKSDASPLITGCFAEAVLTRYQEL